MKWKNQYHEFDKIAEYFCDKRTKYYLWGTANIAANMFRLCGHEINIVGAVDSDKKRWGQKISGVTIESPDVLNPKEGYVILVTTSAYEQVKEVLLKKGFEENINFWDYFIFYQIYQLYAHNKLYSRRIDISLTERCTLKCRKCNMFMPYFQTPADLSEESVQTMVDKYFALIDFVESFNLLGGEPFLYDSLPEIIKYVGNKYRERLEHFKVFTNGMILPEKGLLELIRKYDVEIQISDYTSEVPYQKRIDQLKTLFDEVGVRYYIIKTSTWGDFGFPENPNNICEGDLISFFEHCKAPFRGLYKDRVYFCYLEASAVRAGLFEENENDYFDLNQKDKYIKQKFLEFDFGYSLNGAVSFCRVCRGCYPQNKLSVPSAEQM